MEEHKWEAVCKDANSETRRMKVPGGLIYQTLYSQVSTGMSISMCFVPTLISVGGVEPVAFHDNLQGL